MDGDTKEVFCCIGRELAESGLIGERRAHAETRAALLAERVLRERAQGALTKIQATHQQYSEGPFAGDHECSYSTGVTDGHRCAAQIARDALASLPAPDLLPKLREVEKAAAPLIHFIDQWERKPIDRMDDQIYGIHAGTEWEAVIRRSDLRNLRNALATLRGLIGGE